MEDLYSDLENYQFENVVSELRNENQELKCKLQQYDTTVANLQKDFDKLSEEYKKLELNYSSLLKTARAEIERKSQLITNLNIEKDKLVIESFQSRGRIIHKNKNAMGYKQQMGNQPAKEAVTDVTNVEHAAASRNSNDVSGTLHNDRNGKHENPTVSQNANLKADVKEPDIIENGHKIKISELHRDNDDRSKNDVKKAKENHSDAVVSKVSKIRDRRKSMPLMNRCDLKFSSDEDQDYGRKDHRKRKTPLRDDRIITDRVHYDKNRYGRNDYDKKGSEFGKLDKYASNYDSSRDAYRKSNSRYRENDRHKSRDNRDKYESGQKSRRHYSPDRPYNTQGDYYNKHRMNDKPYKSDNIRYRTLISPPPDKYNRHRRSREFDGQRLQHEDVYTMKHKMYDSTEEPTCKRLRRESFNKLPDKYVMSGYDIEVEGRANSMSSPLEFSHFSLQSPDYVHLENPIHQVKEIKCTSEIKLDDPRAASKRYIVNKHRDKTVLSTIVGRDVDLKAIDTSTWEMDNDKNIHEMPTPLRERPLTNDDFAKHIYIGMDDPMLNDSLESGEIGLEDMGVVGENKGIANTDMVTVSPQEKTYKNVDNNIQKYDQTEANNIESTDRIDKTHKTSPTLTTKKYKIPKLNKSNTSEILENDTHNTKNKHTKKDKQGHKRKSSKEKKELEKKNQPEITNNNLKVFSDAIDVSKKKSNKSVEKHYRKHSQEQAVISARDTVEGDLELSDDETCDYVDLYKGNNGHTHGELEKNVVTDGLDKDVNKELQKSDSVSKERAVTKKENKHFNILHKGSEFLPKESRSKIHKEQKSKDIKNKLCDLFGESSSLITLDDLGVAASNSTKQNLNEYAPLFDNTQDAVDFNVEEMEKVQTGCMKLQGDEDKPSKDGHQDLTSEESVKNKNKDKTSNDKKFSNIDKTSPIKHIFENVKSQPVDNSVVKTVIISTGVQNSCSSVEVGREGDKGNLSTNVQRKSSNIAAGCPSLLNIKALATSTPCKPQDEYPLSTQQSCITSESATEKNTSNVSSNTESICKTNQSNSDVPDVRIIVKRRRKAKGAPS